MYKCTGTLKVKGWRKNLENSEYKKARVVKFVDSKTINITKDNKGHF